MTTTTNDTGVTAITVELPDGGSVTWTPSDHSQQHLEGFSDEERGATADLIKSVLAACAQQVKTLCCLIENPYLMILADLGLVGGFSEVTSLFGEEPDPTATSPFGDDGSAWSIPDAYRTR